MANQFDPIQTSPTMVWTKYPNFQVPDDPPLATNRAVSRSIPGCDGLPMPVPIPNPIPAVPAATLVRSIRSLRRRPTSGVGATAETAAAVGSLVSSTVYVLVQGTLGYYVGKWSGASRGWTAVGAALFGVPGTFVSLALTGARKKASTTPNCRCRPLPVKANSKPYRSAKTWDLLWENYIAARRSGNKKRILDTAELLEFFDRSTGYEPTVTVRRVKKEFGWK